MSLLVYNLTAAPLVLANGLSTTIPASTAGAGVRGEPWYASGDELEGRTVPQYTALQAQQDAGLVQFEWEASQEYPTPGLTVGIAVRDVLETAVAIYVNAAAAPATGQQGANAYGAGSDTNPGTLALPVQTFVAALALLPKAAYQKSCRIYFADGTTYTAPVNADDCYLPMPVGPNATPLTFIGGRQTLLSGAVPVSTGVPAVYYANAIVDTVGAPFGATDSLIGYWVQMTSGAATGQWRQIKGNTSTQLETNSDFSAAVVNGDTYVVAKPAVKLTVANWRIWGGDYTFLDMTTDITGAPQNFFLGGNSRHCRHEITGAAQVQILFGRHFFGGISGLSGVYSAETSPPVTALDDNCGARFACAGANFRYGENVGGFQTFVGCTVTLGDNFDYADGVITAKTSPITVGPSAAMTLAALSFINEGRLDASPVTLNNAAYAQIVRYSSANAANPFICRRDAVGLMGQIKGFGNSGTAGVQVIDGAHLQMNDSLVTTTTTVDAPMTALQTTLNVTSAASFAATGVVQIDNELISYTGKGATTLTGCLRGANGSTPATHVLGSTVSQGSTVTAGAGKDMKVGQLPVRTWSDFYTVAPITNEYDVTGDSARLSVAGSTARATGFAAPQALPGPGAVDVVARTTLFTSTGVGNALTLANGRFAAQRKTVYFTAKTGTIADSAVLTPSVAGNFATASFANVGDWFEFEWSGTAWNIVDFGIKTDLMSAPQVLPGGGGAVNLTTRTTLFTSTGVGDALTLANGLFVCQRKTVWHAVAGGTGILTPATPGNFATVAFAVLYSWAEFEWSGTAWNVVGFGGGAVVAP